MLLTKMCFHDLKQIQFPMKKSMKLEQLLQVNILKNKKLYNINILDHLKTLLEF